MRTTYGKLTVLNKVETDTGKTATSKTTKHRCLCKCSRVVTVLTHNLKSGNTTSCGKCRSSFLKAGQRFHNLTIIKIQDADTYLCRCKCGNVKVVRQTNLLSGRSKSCGDCQHRLIIQEGQTFGHIVVLENWDGSSDSQRMKTYLCGCDCGNPKPFWIRGAELRAGRRISCGKCKEFLFTARPARWQRIGVPDEIICQYEDLLTLVAQIREADPECREIFNQVTGTVIWRDDAKEIEIVKWGIWDISAIKIYNETRPLTVKNKE